ncbi:gamma-glutamylcyclotransferase [Leptolyngbyaceae cyanobacterium UHCC 1019]
MIKVFVYGTLKPGEVNYHVCDRWVIETCPAIAFGTIYQLPFGYPAMVAGGRNLVQGVLLSFADSAILQELDEFEQHDPNLFQCYFPELSLDAHQYERQAIAVHNPKGVSLGSAWAYLMTSTQVQQINGVWVPSGDWRSIEF